MAIGKQSKMGITLKVEIESLKSIETKLRSRIRQLEKMAQINLRVDTQNVTSGIRQIDQSLTSLNRRDTNLFQGQDEQIRRTNSELSRLTTSTEQFEFALDRVIARYARWGLMHLTMNALVNAMLAGVQAVERMDVALTTMNITLSGTARQFQIIGMRAVEFAKQYKTSISNVLTAMEIYTNMNETIDQILEKSRSTIILSNLTGNDIGSSSDALQGIINQFNLTADATDHLVDAMTALGADTTQEFATSIQNITDAVSRGGEVASQAGLSAEQYMSIISTLSEQSRMAGSNVAFGLQTIFSRLTRVGDLGAEEAFQLQKAFKDIANVDLVDDDGNFRDMWYILEETSKVYDQLSDAEKEYLNFVAGGTRQKRYFISLMENFMKIQERSILAYESEGFAMERQEIYANSLRASLENLKSVVGGYFIETFDRQYIKNFLDTISSFFEVMNDFDEIFGSALQKGITGILSSIIGFEIAPMIAKGIYNLAQSFTKLSKTTNNLQNSMRFLTKEETKKYLRIEQIVMKSTDAMNNYGIEMKQLEGRIKAQNEVVESYNMLKEKTGYLLKEEQIEMDKATNKIEDYKNQYKELQVLKRSEEFDHKMAVKRKKEYEVAMKQRKLVSYTVSGILALSTAISGLRRITDDSLRTLEKFNIGLDAMGNALLMIPNQYAMITGAILKLASVLVGVFDEAYEDIVEIAERMGKELDDAISKLEKYTNIKFLFETEINQEDYDDLFNKQSNSENALDVNLYTDQEFEMMKKILEVMPDLTKAYDANGRVVVKLNDSYENFMNTLNQDISDTASETNKKAIESAIADWDSLYLDMKRKEREIKNIEKGLVNRGNRSMIGEEFDQQNERLSIANEELENLKTQMEDTIDRLTELRILVYNENPNSKIKGFFELFGINLNKKSDITALDSWVAETLQKMNDQYARNIEKFNENTDAISDYVSILDELREGNGLSAESYQKILEKYDDLVGFIDDEIQLQKELEEATEKSNETRGEILKESLYNSVTFYDKTKVKFKDHFKELNKQYKIDAKNFTTLMGLKLGLIKAVLLEMGKLYSREFTSEEDFYGYLGRMAIEDEERAEKIASNYEKEVYRGIKPFETDVIDIVNKLIKELLGGLFGGTSETKSMAKALSSLVDVFKDLYNQLELNQDALDHVNNILDTLPEYDPTRIQWLEKENKLLEDRNIIYNEIKRLSLEAMDENKNILQGFGVSFDDYDMDYESYINAVSSLNAQLEGAGTELTAYINDQLSKLRDAFSAYDDAQSQKLRESENAWLDNKRAIHENVLEINSLSLEKYQKDIDDTTQALEALGELDSFEKYVKQTQLFNLIQKTLKNQLKEVTQRISEYREELSNLSDDSEENQIKTADLRAEIERLDGLKADIEVNILTNYEDQKAQMLDVIQSVEQDIIQMIENRIDLESDAETDRHETRLENLEIEKQEMIDRYDIELKALKKLKEEQDYQENIGDLRKEKSEIETQILDLSRDDSLEAVARQKELRERLAEVEKDISDSVREYEYDEAEQAIEDRKTAEEEIYEARIESLNDEFDQYLVNIERRKEQDKIYEEARRILTENSIEEIGKMLLEESNRWGEGMSIVGDNINDDILTRLQYAKTLLEELGFNSFNYQIGDEIMDLENLTIDLDAEAPELQDSIETGFEDINDNSDDNFDNVQRSIDKIVYDSSDLQFYEDFNEYSNKVTNYLKKIVISLDKLGSNVTINNDYNINGVIDTNTSREIQTINDSLFKNLSKQGIFTIV